MYRVRNRSGLPKIFDIDTFLWIKGFSFIRLAPDQLQASLELKRFVCPNCGSIYAFEGDEYSRFSWLLNSYQKTPVNIFENRDPKFSNLAQLSAYRVHSISPDLTI